jgi:hypothetical protein
VSPVCQSLDRNPQNFSGFLRLQQLLLLHFRPRRFPYLFLSAGLYAGGTHDFQKPVGQSSKISPDARNRPKNLGLQSPPIGLPTPWPSHLFPSNVRPASPTRAPKPTR